MALSEEKRASWMLLIAAFLWGSSFVGSKICLNAGMLQFETIFYRSAIGTFCLALIFRKQLQNMERGALLAGAVLGILSSLGYTFELYGITVTETTKVAFLSSTNIVMMPVLCVLFFHTRLRPRTIFAALLTMAGVGFLSLTGEGLSLTPGDSLILFSALMYALNSIAIVKLGGDHSRIQITFIQLLVITIYTGVMTLVQGRCGHYEIKTVGAILYLAIGPTLVCFVLKNYAIKYVGPIKCTLILASESIFCALLSMVLLHDQVTLRMLMGIVLIMCGIFMEELGDTLFSYLSG